MNREFVAPSGKEHGENEVLNLVGRVPDINHGVVAVTHAPIPQRLGHAFRHAVRQNLKHIRIRLVHTAARHQQAALWAVIVQCEVDASVESPETSRQYEGRDVQALRVLWEVQQFRQTMCVSDRLETTLTSHRRSLRLLYTGLYQADYTTSRPWITTTRDSV